MKNTTGTSQENPRMVSQTQNKDGTFNATNSTANLKQSMDKA